MPETESESSVLHAWEAQELRALQSAVDKGKMDFNSPQWERWKLLVRAQSEKRRDLLDGTSATVPETSSSAPAPSTPRSDDAYFAQLYFPDTALASAKIRIGRLRKTGRDYKDLPPFESPHAMLEWHARLNSAGAFKYKTDLLDRLTAAAAAAGPPSNVIPLPQTAAESPPSPQSADESDIAAASDPVRQLAMLELEAARIGQELSALRSRNETPAVIDAARRRWVEATAAATALRTRLQKEGTLISKDAATAAFQRIIHAVPPALLRELTARLPDIPQETLAAALRDGWAAAMSADILAA